MRHLGYALNFDKWRHRSRPYRDLSPKINMSPRSFGVYLPADKISDRIYASAYLVHTWQVMFFKAGGIFSLLGLLGVLLHTSHCSAHGDVARHEGHQHHPQMWTYT